MSALSTLDANDLRHQFRGALVEPGDERWDASRQAFNLTFDQEPMLIAFPVDSADVQVLVTYAAGRGIELAPAADGPQRRAAGLARRHDPRQDRRHARRRDRRRAPRRPGPRPARNGRTSCRPRRTSASLRCTARRPTSASSATRSAAASAGMRASSACRRTACSRSSSSRPTAGSAASTPTTTPTCSGRCAAAAATSAS